MNKNAPLILGIIIVAIAVVIFATQTTVHEEIHYHAGFQVYVDNKLQDFSDIQYMSTKPCTLHEENEPMTADEIQNEKAHLHDRIGDVVHTHVTGAVWSDLFKNINFVFPVNKPVKSYVNGQLYSENILTKPLAAYESVVIFIGTNTDIDKKLAGAVTKARMLEVESKSEDCGVKH